MWVFVKRLLLNKPQILNPFLSLGGGMRGRSQARYRPWASYSLLMVLWLPQWPHLAAFIPHSEEGCNKRESVSCYVWVFWGASIRYNPANTDTGSWLLWGSSRVPTVLNGGGAAETNHSPFPPQHYCEASNSSKSTDRQRSHRVPVSAGQQGPFVLALG